MQIVERLRGSVRFVREGVYQNCPNTMSNNDRRINTGNDISSNQNESIEEVNTPTLTTEPLELPDSPENERSIICCCFTSETALRVLFLSYWIWSLLAFVFSVDTIFPALYLFPICFMLIAFIGSSIGVYQLLLPFMFMVAWDMLYATTCAIFLVSFHKNDRYAMFNKLIYDYWPQKAKEFDEMSRDFFEVCLIIFFFKIFYSMAAFIITGQEVVRFKLQQYFEVRRREIIRQRVLLDLREESRLQSFLIEAAQTNESQNPYAQLFSQRPPPPSYQTFSHPVLRTPQLGTPPPTYSMLERDGRLEPVPIQWSPDSQNNNQSGQINASETSFNCKRSEGSTAMSPSSFLHSPPFNSSKE
uniref:Uncharacterized protein n=1 Tax=Panagrolaimus superbus TaxID=310955 RepID=A0A914XWY4_9BILA